jgi:hypothetical protein
MTPDPQWYFARNGQQLGPVSLDALRQMIASAQLTASDLVWCEGMADWQPAGQVPALRPPPVVPMRAPIAPPPPAVTPAPAQPVNAAYASQPVNRNYASQPVAAPYGAKPLPYYPSGQSYNGLAIAGFVCTFLMAPLGLILSLVALNGMKNSGNFEGRGLAKAGAIVSGIFIGMWFIFACLWFTFMAAAIGAGAGR